MNKTRLFALACIIAVVPLAFIAKASAGAVFKTVDDQGNVTFTDKPPADSDSREIKIRPVNSQKPTELPPEPEPEVALSPNEESNAKDEEEEVAYSSSLITRPLNNSSVPPGQREVVVQIGLNPPLQTGHSVKFYHNGTPHRSATTDTRFTLTELIPGEHTVRAQIFGRDGKRKAETQTITFYVHRYTAPKSKPRPR